MSSESPSESTEATSAFEWSSNRLAVTYQEARTVLNAQQTRKQNTDDKALRTVRLTTIIVGVLISLIEALDLTVSTPIVATGGVFLVVAFAAGIATYNATNLYLGPNQEYIETLVADNFDDGETAWEGDLLRLMGEWIGENDRDLQSAGRLLILTDIALLIGLVLSTAAIVL